MLFRSRYGDMLLVDGGVTNPLPLNRIQRNEGDLLVSVNVSAPFEASVGTSGEQETNIPKLVAAMLEKGKQLTKLNYVSIMSRITSIMIVQNAELMTQMYHPDMSVLMAKNHYGSYEYDRADEIIACGYDMMINEIHRYESSYPFG